MLSEATRAESRDPSTNNVPELTHTGRKQCSEDSQSHLLKRETSHRSLRTQGGTFVQPAGGETRQASQAERIAYRGYLCISGKSLSSALNHELYGFCARRNGCRSCRMRARRVLVVNTSQPTDRERWNTDDRGRSACRPGLRPGVEGGTPTEDSRPTESHSNPTTFSRRWFRIAELFNCAIVFRPPWIAPGTSRRRSMPAPPKLHAKEDPRHALVRSLLFVHLIVEPFCLLASEPRLDKQFDLLRCKVCPIRLRDERFS